MSVPVRKLPIVCRAAFAAALLVVPLLAQSVGPRVYEADPKLQREKRARKTVLPSLKTVLAAPMEYRLAPLTAEELQPKIQKMAGHAGVHRAVEPEAARLGAWSTLDDGRRIWRLALQSPDAAGIRVHFRRFNVGNGRVWLHDGSGRDEEIMGPYARQGPDDSGNFWSDFVLSDKLTIEFEPDGAMSLADPLPFEIAEISHLFPRALPGGSPDLTLEKQPSAFSQAPRNGLSVQDVTFQPYGAASCNVDVSCFPDWTETARAVGHIVYEDDGHTYVCSGTLLNTMGGSGIPYFLTADHCISNEASARTVQAFWSYQTSTCNGPPANRRDAQRTLGARYLTSGGVEKGDFSLIRLNEIPSGVLLSGWTAEEVLEGTNLVGIHHPSGDYKRISFSMRVPTGRQMPGANPAYYYTVRQSRGVTEGGSSGSGLFAAPGVVIGMLSSGPKVDTPEQICQIAQPPANYGRLSAAYPALRDFLEDRTTAPPPPPPPNGNGNPNGNNPNNPGGSAPTPGGAAGPTVLTSGSPKTFNIDSVSGATLLNGDRSFVIDVHSGAQRLEIRLSTSTPGVDIDLFAKHGSDPAVSNGKVVADYNSDGPTGNEIITITPASSPALQSGRYFISLAVFTTATPATGTVIAAVVGSDSRPPAPPGRSEVTPEAPVRFQLPAVAESTLFIGQYGYRVNVPQGATKLQINVQSDARSVDVDLYVRHSMDVEFVNGDIVADHASESETGNERITITSASSPALRPGTYYIGLALFSKGVSASGSISVSIERSDDRGPGGTVSSAKPLTLGQPVTFTLPPVDQVMLFTGDNGFRVTVPEGSGRLEITLKADNPAHDLDLYVRYGAEVTLAESRPVADHRSAGDTGEEQVVIDGRSSPPLRPGVYFIGFGQFSTGVSTRATVVARVTGPSLFRDEVDLQKTSFDSDSNRLHPKPAHAIALPMSYDAKRAVVHQIEMQPENVPLQKVKAFPRIALKQD